MHPPCEQQLLPKTTWLVAQNCQRLVACSSAGGLEFRLGGYQTASVQLSVMVRQDYKGREAQLGHTFAS